MREKILFDTGWLFHRGDIDIKTPAVKGPVYTSAKTERKKQGPACIYYNDAPDDFRTDVEYNADHWENIQLPHDYIIEGRTNRNNNPALGFFTYDNGWYRKHFQIAEAYSNKRITLYFEGVATRCSVYLNGCELKHNFCGYTPFEVEISDFLYYGARDNVLAVYTCYDDNEGWWYQGGGIYRHVWLNITSPLCVDLYGVYAAPVKNSGDNWTVNYETTLVNDFYKDTEADIVTTLIDPEGNEVSRAQAYLSIAERSRGTVCYNAQVLSPSLWDLDHPTLYEVITKVYTGGQETDCYRTRIGFRTIRFDAEQGFFLNGKKTVIYGVCGHGDFGLTGKAVPDNVFRYKTRLIKQMGANGYRCSHYPQAEAAMDSFDEQGLLVMAETRWFDSSEEGRRQLEIHMKRDRNRPSVIMWSLGNEEPHHLTDIGRRINKNLYHFAKKLDKYRPLTSAVSNEPEHATVYDEADVIGVNYNHWSWDQVHQAHPDKPMYISECCATGTTRGWYFEDSIENARSSAYDSDSNMWWTSRERFMKLFAKRPYLFGFFQWIAFEHRGEAMWPRLCSVAGAIDLFCQKKDAFYQNLSHFTNEPMVHLLPHWNFDGLAGMPVHVCAYTNCEEVELCLNGEIIGRQAVDRYSHAQWTVAYCPGTLTATAYQNGKRAAQETIQTTGRPVSLKLLHETEGDVAANGEDLALFTCICLDEHGQEVPDASPTVSFHTNALGMIVGTGSDNTDQIPVSSTVRKMYAGRILAAVKTCTKPGTLTLYAHADGLKSASISILLT